MSLFFIFGSVEQNKRKHKLMDFTGFETNNKKKSELMLGAAEVCWTYGTFTGRSKCCTAHIHMCFEHISAEPWRVAMSLCHFWAQSSH